LQIALRRRFQETLLKLGTAQEDMLLEGFGAKLEKDTSVECRAPPREKKKTAPGGRSLHGDGPTERFRQDLGECPKKKKELCCRAGKKKMEPIVAKGRGKEEISHKERVRTPVPRSRSPSKKKEKKMTSDLAGRKKTGSGPE